MEASKNSKRAMASADRLGKLMPGVAHMIHMPSHIYIRNGEYKKGIIVNEMSVKGYVPGEAFNEFHTCTKPCPRRLKFNDITNAS